VLAKQRPAPGAGKLLGLLDIGTSKVVCLIVRLERRHATATNGPLTTRLAASLLGIGHQRSRGLKAGVIVDLDEAEQAIRAAVSEAEHMAGVRLREVQVSVACGCLMSAVFVAEACADGRVVHDSDIERLMTAGRAYAERNGRTLVYMNRVGFRLDGAGGIRDPRGMAAAALSAELHAVTADEAPLRNLLHVIERCYLTVAGMAPAPYASALAATTEDERCLGVLSIDIGAGITTLALIAEGHLLWLDVLPIGGHHITFDIARTVATPLAEAERIKTLYGTLLEAQSDEHEIISFPLAGEEEPTLHQATKAQIREIIEPRARALLSLVAERIAGNELARHALDRVVITGGSSQLTGLGKFAAKILGRPVRISRPSALTGVPANLNSPAFSTVLGLISFITETGPAVRFAGQDRVGGTTSYIGRMGQWIRESF
jgi:cell division protein FtsA